MDRSTANFISYDLRPSKQSERRILIDVLKSAGDCGIRIPDYRYVGMGANRFYDFLLVHKYLGIKNMVSLEHDPQMHKRAMFNVPYSFIEIYNEKARDFIERDQHEGNTIYWLDYDGGIGARIATDISTLGPNMKLGDFAFATVYGGPPKILEKKKDNERLVWLQDSLGDYARNLVLAEMQNSKFVISVYKMLVAVFKNAFAQRRDGKFVFLLEVSYSDSKTMITVGGALLDEKSALDIPAMCKENIGFLYNKPGNFYNIKSQYLTEKERALFDLATTAKRKRSAQYNKLVKLGFSDTDINSYKELLRYLPRYVETMI